ncbi:MAG: hypothetical protein H7645_05240 [Candidatus Heimdallarchaeota archaeon]|nr:hypothetical protein [Candidatus Heimdallarchaeota archaeon]MCK4769726.1 hypothetical protein [Candidatus Heimdallarchaeota archaeon]
MKPMSLCLINMGVKGLELIKSFPDVIPSDSMNQLVYKTIPIGSNPGDFATTTFNDLNLSSFIFRIPSADQRDNLASLVAVFSSSDYDSKTIKQVFSWVVSELDKKDLLNKGTLENILPKLYKGFNKGQFKIEITSTSSISFSFKTESKSENGQAIDDLADDLW